jgi:ribosomal protein S27E
MDAKGKRGVPVTDEEFARCGVSCGIVPVKCPFCHETPRWFRPNRWVAQCNKCGRSIVAEPLQFAKP